MQPLNESWHYYGDVTDVERMRVEWIATSLWRCRTAVLVKGSKSTKGRCDKVTL